MLVRDRMSSPAVTVPPKMNYIDAFALMQERGFRRLPVVNDRGLLVGIVAERDLLTAGPSAATTLSKGEANYLLGKLHVADMMSQPVITATETMPIEDAAQLMISRKIGGLPVVNAQGSVVGVITETDIFKAFTELLGGGEHGVRVEVRVPEQRGVLASITRAITDLGGNILSLGTFDDKTQQTRILLLKVSGVNKEDLAAGLAALGEEVVELRVV